jgi:alkanesulfonate monooxygenase SsuD/methylene tetrahydromethanopterin reductase-like flavin-dependent oxidoreductase (luciferase family)
VEIGIGLPSTIRGCDRTALLEWARRADAAGFSSVGTIDRVVYDNLESLVTLAAVAAVTERVRLTTAILIAPLHGSGALLAKMGASLDVISRGRLVVGLAVGGREDDFTATGVDFHRRGRIFDEQLATMRRVWSEGEPGVGPRPFTPAGPRVLVGGTSDAAMRRVVEHGEGWISGGGGPEAFSRGAGRARAAWRDAGREGVPRLAALAYFALGSTARADADAYLRDYYAFLGPYADRVAAGAAVGDHAVREQVAAFLAAGCDELILFPSSTDPAQVDLLAETALRG